MTTGYALFQDVRTDFIELALSDYAGLEGLSTVYTENWREDSGQVGSRNIGTGDLTGDGNEDIVYSVGNTVYAVDQDTNLLWKYQTDGTIRTSVVVDDINGNGNNDVLFGSNDNYVYLLDRDGNLKWRHYSLETSSIDDVEAIQIGTSASKNPVYTTRDIYLHIIKPNGTDYIHRKQIGPEIKKGDINNTNRKNLVTGGQILSSIRTDFGTNEEWRIRIPESTDFALRGTHIEDVTGDGNANIVVANAGSDRPGIFLLDQDGNISWYFSSSNGVQAQEIIVKDITGNGDKDIVFSDGTDTVYCVDKDGNQNWSFTGAGDRIGVADINNDSNLETIVYDYTGTDVYAIDNAGNQLWSYSTGTDSLNGGTGVSFADLNSNNNIETIVGSEDNGIIYAIDSTGSLFNSYDDATTDISTIDVGDLTGDGSIDIVYSNGNGFVKLLNNDFTTIEWTYGDFANNSNAGINNGLIVDDVDGDSVPEVIAHSAGTIYQLDNNGSVEWVNNLFRNSAVGTPSLRYINLEDINSNGDKDIVFIDDFGPFLGVIDSSNGEVLSAYRYKLSGGASVSSFNTSQVLSGAPSHIALSTDHSPASGSPDRIRLLSLYDSEGISIEVRNGLGAGDFSIDPDIGVVNESNSRFYSIDNEGIVRGAFAGSQSTNSQIAVGDFNGNSEKDFAFTALEPGGTYSSIFAVDGKKKLLATKNIIKSGKDLDVVAPIDSVGDGIKDFYASDISNGADVFTNTHDDLSGIPAIGPGFSLGGFYGDGTESLAIANGSNNTLEIYKLIGDNYREIINKSIPSVSGPVNSADMTGNGDWLVLAGTNSEVEAIDPDNGNTIFTGNYSISGLDIALADLTGNGELDVIVAGGQSGSDRVTAYNRTGTELWTYTFNDETVNNVVTGDVTGDGNPNVVVAQINNSNTTPTGKIVLFDENGNEIWGSYYAQPQLYGNIDLADISGDGTKDIIYAYQSDRLEAIDESRGVLFQSQNRDIGTITTQAYQDALVAEDIAGDGNIDILFGGSDGIVRFDSSGGIVEEFGSSGHGLQSGMVVGDVDNDGDKEITCAVKEPNGTGNDVYVFHSKRGSLLWEHNDGNTTARSNGVSAWDLNGNGKSEVIAGWNSKANVIESYSNTYKIVSDFDTSFDVSTIENIGGTEKLLYGDSNGLGQKEMVDLFLPAVDLSSVSEPGIANISNKFLNKLTMSFQTDNGFEIILLKDL